MTEPKPPKKRLVPVHEYVGRKATRAVLFSLGGYLLLTGIIGMLISLSGLVLSFPMWLLGFSNVSFTLLALISGLISWGLFSAGQFVGETADKIEDVERLTFITADKLPAEETLVRASTEPTQQQEKVLLRAATASEETPPEQLLRPDASQTV
jgi:hypothetical protein